MNPGPIEFDSAVLREMHHKGVSHVDKQFIDKFGESLEMMRKVFLSPNGQPLIISGSGTLGWDMVGANLLSTGDAVLVVNTGYFGDHLADCLAIYGAQIEHLRAAAVGGRPLLSELKVALKKQRFKMITLTHVDTSTGVLTDLKAMASTIRNLQPDALIVIDGVCALGGEECRMTEWDLDVVITGSQKCIGVPSGLSLLMVSPRALRVFEKQPQLTSYYCSWKNWIPIMTKYENRMGSYFATPAVNHVYALHTALCQLLANGGMEARFNEHLQISTAMKEAITSLGCSQVPTSREAAANTMTCVRFPKGVNGPAFLKCVVENGVSLSGGLHKQIKSEYFRIGHMGPSTRRLDHVLLTIKAIEAALTKCGHQFRKGAGVERINQLKTSLPSITKRVGCPFRTSSCSGCPAPPACQLMTLALMTATFLAGWALGSRRN